MNPAFRYRRLGYVALNVTNLAASRRFYGELLGLQEAGTTASGDVAFRCSSRHHDVLLREAPVAGLRRVGWQMESAGDLAALRAHLAGPLGLAVHDVPASCRPRSSP